MSSPLENKRRLYGLLYELMSKKDEKLLSSLYREDVHWRGSHPLNEKRGLPEVLSGVYAGLWRSFPDLERRDMIVLGGSTEGRDYVACVGCYSGTFCHSWLTIPPTGKTTSIRYGEVYALDSEGRIVQSSCLWDILDVMRQSGFCPLALSLGSEGVWYGPITGDGLVLYETDEEEGRESLRQTLGMHEALASHDDEKSMTVESFLDSAQKAYWHEHMMWYGPSGIGTTRGLEGFVRGHQLPFRKAFPNRLGGKQWDSVAEKKEKYGGGHYVSFGDGHYSVTGGWPSVLAEHKGGGFMGLPPSGREVTMRVMDFYLHHEGKIRENWVPLDVLDLLLQMGVDVMERMGEVFDVGGRG